MTTYIDNLCQEVINYFRQDPNSEVDGEDILTTERTVRKTIKQLVGPREQEHQNLCATALSTLRQANNRNVALAAAIGEIPPGYLQGISPENQTRIQTFVHTYSPVRATSTESSRTRIYVSKYVISNNPPITNLDSSVEEFCWDKTENNRTHTRILNNLASKDGKNKKIETFRELVYTSEKSFLARKGLGKVSVEVVRTVLGNNGLFLGMSYQDVRAWENFRSS